MKISDRLRELREEKELSQSELAKITGLSSSSIARWELAQSEPKASQIIILAKFFNESTDYLLGVEE